jgi:hypothetical protein
MITSLALDCVDQIGWSMFVVYRQIGREGLNFPTSILMLNADVRNLDSNVSG